MKETLTDIYFIFARLLSGIFLGFLCGLIVPFIFLVSIIIATIQYFKDGEE